MGTDTRGAYALPATSSWRWSNNGFTPDAYRARAARQAQLLAEHCANPRIERDTWRLVDPGAGIELRRRLRSLGIGFRVAS